MCSPEQQPCYVYLVKSGTFAVEKQIDVSHNMNFEGTAARFVELRTLKLFSNKPTSKTIRLSLIEENEFVGEEIIGRTNDRRYAFNIVCVSSIAKVLRFPIEIFMWLPRPILKSVQLLFEAKLALRMRCLRNVLSSETLQQETWTEDASIKEKQTSRLTDETVTASPIPIEMRHFAKSTRATYEKGDFKNQKLLRSVIESHLPFNLPLYEEEDKGESYFDYRRTHRKARDGKLRLITLRNCKRAIEISKRNFERERLNENCK